MTQEQIIAIEGRSPMKHIPESTGMDHEVVFPGSLPKVTIIVATYNSVTRSHLTECLESISRLSYQGEVELIVADGGSTDSTIELASKHRAKVIHNPAVTELGYEGGKNLALTIATGDFIMIVDADNVLIEKTYIDMMLEPFMVDPQVVVAVPTPYVPVKGRHTQVCRFFCLQERDFWQSLSVKGCPTNDWIKFSPKVPEFPNAGLVRRATLRQIGGWDYDTEVARRIMSTAARDYALVLGAHRFHNEMRGYGDIWKKVDRRVRNQIRNQDKKHAVASQITRMLHDPITYFRSELSVPLFHALYQRDLAYLQVLPVFCIKHTLFLARKVWRARAKPL